MKRWGVVWYGKLDSNRVASHPSTCVPKIYVNMSNRFMATLRQFSPRQEVYSIDECFLDLTGIKRDLVAYGQEIKETVTSWTGLPI